MTSLKGASAILLALLLGGCITDGSALPNVACKTFSPLGWNKADTRPTIRGIKGHNAAYVSLCR